MTGIRARARRAASQAVETLTVVAVSATVEVGLRVTTLPRLCRWLGIEPGMEPGTAPGTAPGTGPATGGPGEIAVLPVWARRHVTARDRVLGAWPFGDTCLRRCLVLGQRLRGLDPVLRIGVHPDGRDGRPGAHSWLEIGGLPVEEGVERYAVLGAHR